MELLSPECRKQIVVWGKVGQFYLLLPEGRNRMLVWENETIEVLLPKGRNKILVWGEVFNMALLPQEGRNKILVLFKTKHNNHIHFVGRTHSEST